MLQNNNSIFLEDTFIATVIDRGFVELAGVMLKSLVDNGQIGNCKLVVVCDGLRIRDKENIRRSARPRDVIFLDITTPVLAKIRSLPTNSNWSRTIYARLLLPELLNVHRGKILYLDADILILRSIQPLLSLDLKNFPVAASSGFSSEVALRLKLDASTKMLNSGVLLFDVENWRRERLSEKSMAVASEKASLLKFFDQDALNIALAGEFLSLGGEWNNPGLGDLSEVSILHYTHDKPNSVRCKHPAKNLYLEYRSATPWANKPLQSVWHKRLNRVKHSIKRKLRMV